MLLNNSFKLWNYTFLSVQLILQTMYNTLGAFSIYIDIRFETLLVRLHYF